MGQTIKLTNTQWEQLDHLRMSKAMAEVFRNYTIILMSAVGRSKASISEDLGCCTDTVARVRRLYREGAIQALHPITVKRWHLCLIIMMFTKKLHDTLCVPI
jgi:hypothetical protein